MKTNLILFVALASFAAPALAAPALAATVPANFYECQGKGAIVTYAKTSITGDATITFQLSNGTITRSGKAIQTQATVLGDLVTVVRPAATGSFIDTLTLVVPTVNLTDRLTGVSFTTQLFSTRTAVVGPTPAGIIQQSEAQPLTCKASLSVF